MPLNVQASNLNIEKTVMSTEFDYIQSAVKLDT